MLYLVRGLLNMVQDYTWEENSDAKVRVYIGALPLLAAMSQEAFLYSIPKGEPFKIRAFKSEMAGTGPFIRICWSFLQNHTM